MNNDGLELIKQTIAALEAKRIQPPPQVLHTSLSQLTQSLIGGAQESPAEIVKLQSALVF